MNIKSDALNTNSSRKEELKNNRKRELKTSTMNLAVQQRIDTENGILSQKLENLCMKIKDGMVKIV